MKISFLGTSTLPNKRDRFFQIVFIPTISVYSSYSMEKHYAFNVEWLFWAGTMLIYKND
jgi:hypothetical protein